MRECPPTTRWRFLASLGMTRMIISMKLDYVGSNGFFNTPPFSHQGLAFNARFADNPNMMGTHIARCLLVGALLVIGAACQSSDRARESAPSTQAQTPLDESSQGRSESDTARKTVFTEGYGDLVWGSSSEAVRERFKDEYLSVGRNRLGEPLVQYFDTLMGLSCEVSFSFNKNRLYAVHLDFNIEGMDSTTIMKAFDHCNAMASGEYGDPAWIRETSDTLGPGVQWFSPETEVLLGYLRHPNYKPHMSIRYRCPDLSYPENMPPML